MGRRGELFDQDAEPEPSAPDSWGPPVHAGRGVLYDQDASIELPRIDPLQAARYQRELDRRREREIELRRETGSSIRISSAGTQTPRAPTADSGPAPPARPRTPATSPPVRISSRAAPFYPPVPAPGPDLSRSGQLGEPPSTGRATAILAFGTFASRLTGFLRVLAIGYVLGVGVLSDAFNYANGVPNIVYDLLLGGILSATLVPVFVEQLADDDPVEASRSISAVFTAIASALVLVSGLLYLAAPAVIHFYLLLSPHSTGAAEKALATRLLRDFAPQVFFLGATVASTALLNARRRFTAAAVSPVVNNVVAIGALIATKVAADHVLGRRGLSASASLDQFSRDGRAVLILGLGTTLGYAVQLLVQLPATRQLGLRLRPVWDLRHPAVRKVAVLSSWLIGVVLTNQASLALVMILAGRTVGGVTAYQFSYQFFQLPYALVAVSVASAIMPDLSEHWWAKRYTRFERQFVTGLRVTLAALTPIAVLYVVVAKPFVELAIHHGAVSPAGAHLVGRTLAYFVAGLPGFAAFFLLMRAFQAMQDARSMFRIYVLENVLTVIAALALSPSLGVPGLALAWVAPYTVASVYAVIVLRRRPELGPLGGWLTIRALIRIALASLVSGGAAVLVGLPLRSGHGDATVLARLILQVGVAGLVYVYLARALRIRELRPIFGMLSRRR